MVSNDAPVPVRTTGLLPPLPAIISELLADAPHLEASPLAAALAGNPSVPIVPEPQDAPPLRWGVLGAGWIAGRFVEDVSIYSSGTITAVGSRDATKAQAFIDAHPEMGAPGTVRAHGSYEELVADENVDAIYVATPHSHHEQHAMLALEAGKHVLVEKAFTVNAGQARRVLEVARERGLFAMEAMWTRFLPGQVLGQALAASGALGQVHYLRAEHFQSLLQVPRLVRPDLAGGALLDLGVYPMSFIHSFLGRPVSMDVRGALTDAGVDLREIVLMNYADATGVASAAMDSAGATTAEVIGTRARLEYGSGFYAQVPVRVVRPEAEAGDGAAEGTWDARLPGGYQFEAAEVARCVAAGKLESEGMPWQATLEVMELMDEVRQALGVRYPGEEG